MHILKEKVLGVGEVTVRRKRNREELDGVVQVARIDQTPFVAQRAEAGVNLLL